MVGEVMVIGSDIRNGLSSLVGVLNPPIGM